MKLVLKLPSHTDLRPSRAADCSCLLSSFFSVVVSLVSVMFDEEVRSQEPNFKAAVRPH